MGANFEVVYSTETDPTKAFREIVEEALYLYGHSGYSGTMAEKGDFVVIDYEAATRAEAEDMAYTIDDECVYVPRPSERRHPKYSNYATDKWGPAGALRVRDGGWVFFGWCSS